MMIPFGIVVVVREFLSRRALIRAGQELASTRQQLVQHEKLAAVGQLVSGVAHELNNPLQGVLGYAELMLASKPSSLEAEELRAIRDNANRAAGIVRNLLTFAGRTTTARGWQQIDRIVRDAIAVRKPSCRRRASISRSMRRIACRSFTSITTRLEDVIVNLIQNAEAAIASRRDGTSLAPRGARARPWRDHGSPPACEHEPDRIFVEVSDNGSGLRDEDLTRVFDPFFTTREVGQGTGLGLSVCYGIIREHGGQITARNGDVGGAVFTIELPVMAESLVAASCAAAGFAAPAPSRRPPLAPPFAIATPDEATSRRRRGSARRWSSTTRNRMPRWFDECWQAPATTSRARPCRGGRW